MENPFLFGSSHSSEGHQNGLSHGSASVHDATAASHQHANAQAYPQHQHQDPQHHQHFWWQDQHGQWHQQQQQQQQQQPWQASPAYSPHGHAQHAYSPFSPTPMPPMTPHANQGHWQNHVGAPANPWANLDMSSLLAEVIASRQQVAALKAQLATAQPLGTPPAAATAPAKSSDIEPLKTTTFISLKCDLKPEKWPQHEQLFLRRVGQHHPWLKALVAFTEPEWRTFKGTGALPVACPCLLYTSPSPRDRQKSRMPSSA